MNFKKKNIFKFLFFVYFLLYIVSPLCYADDGLSDDITITHGTKQDARNIRVIWEMLFSRLLQKENSEKNNFGVQLIIKKARAVLSSNNIVKAAQSEFYTPLLNDYFPQLESIAFSAKPTNLNNQIGFYSFSSGLSPPCV